MIHVTDKAADQIKTIMQKEGLLYHGLRVAVIGGGCSGMSYKLAFEKEPAGEDKVYEEKGVRIFVDGKSYLFLNGMTLDLNADALLLVNLVLPGGLLLERQLV